MRCITMFGLSLLLYGCGSSFAPVSGIITLNGKPLAHATVVFEPLSTAKETGPGSTGSTDEEGRFSLHVMTTNAAGATIGNHKVSITAYEGDVEGESSAPSATNKVNRKALVPEEYNSKSKLTFEVKPGGTSGANFELKSTRK